jgi:hypothetical protein
LGWAGKCWARKEESEGGIAALLTTASQHKHKHEERKHGLDDTEAELVTVDTRGDPLKGWIKQV